MKRRKQNPRQLCLLDPTFRWSELPLDGQQQLVDQLARLLVQIGLPASQQLAAPHAARHETFPIQENHDESR